MNNITINQTGYGHWSVTTTIYGKAFTFTTTDSRAIDDYQSGETDSDVRRGYNQLRKLAMNVWRSRR